MARPRRDPRGSPRLIGPQYGADARAKDRNVDPPRDSGPALTGGLFFRRCRSRTGSWVALTLRCPAVRGQHHVANPARGECGTRVSQCLTARNPYRVSPGSHWDRARDRVGKWLPLSSGTLPGIGSARLAFPAGAYRGAGGGAFPGGAYAGAGSAGGRSGYPCTTSQPTPR